MIEAGLLFIGLVAGIAAAALAFRPTLKRYARTEEALKADNEAKNVQLIDLNRQTAERAARCAALEEKLLYQQTEAERERAAAPKRSPRCKSSSVLPLKTWLTIFWKRKAASLSKAIGNPLSRY